MTTVYAIGYVTNAKIFLVGFVHARRNTTREKVIDTVLTDSDFVKTLDLIDQSWWYHTDRLVVSLYR